MLKYFCVFSGDFVAKKLCSLADDKQVYIVSGLPRSGTSMMMRMLSQGGLCPFTDKVREADADNPKGYFEYEKVKDLAQDASWLPQARGKVIKIISHLLNYLPQELSYKVVFMERPPQEILASQKKMLERAGQEKESVSDEVMAAKFSIHLRRVKARLAEADNIEVLYLDYPETIKSPRTQAAKINAFFQGRLIEEKMAAVVDKSLYRQRQL